MKKEDCEGPSCKFIEIIETKWEDDLSIIKKYRCGIDKRDICFNMIKKFVCLKKKNLKYYIINK